MVVRRAVTLAVVCCLVLALVPGPAQAAAPLVVTRFDDPPPGTCDPGDCSLREAIIAANAFPGDDTIQLQAGTYQLSRPGQLEDAAATGDLDILFPVTILGAGQTATIIDGGGVDRVFEIRDGGVGSLKDLTVRHGMTSQTGAGSALELGGGVLVQRGGTFGLTRVAISGNSSTAEGGGIANAGGNIILTDSLITQNTAQSDGGLALENGSTASLTNVTVTQNTSTSFAGGIGLGVGTSGNVGERSTLTLTSSQVTSNTALFGGGIMTGPNAVLTVDRSAVSTNVASLGNGGGLWLNGTDGVVTIDHSTIDGNRAVDSGGGIRLLGGTRLTLSNSTVSNNRADGHLGGGIFVLLENAGGGGSATSLAVVNSTISGNNAHDGGSAIYQDVGALFSGTTSLLNTTITANTAGSAGAVNRVGGPLTAKNTIIANNTAPSTPNCTAMLTSQGGNIDGGAECAFTAPGDQQNTNSQLGPLADNGGLTRTHLPTTGSPAIDAGLNAGCPSRDQRDQPRPTDGNGDAAVVCDVGAVETAAVIPQATSSCNPRPRVAVASVAESGRLRVTVSAANNTAAPSNGISSIQIKSPINARIDIGTQTGITSSTTVNFPNHPASVTFFVSRVAPGPTNVPLVIVDDCGQWPTFVGGGPTAF